MSKLQEFMNTTGLSGASIARTLGVSTGTVSLVKNGKTDSVSAENMKKFDDYIDNYQVKNDTDTSASIAFTSDLKMVQFICDEAIIAREAQVIYGKAGSGKTTAIKYYCSTRPESILVETLPMMPLKTVLTQILAGAGVNNATGSIVELTYQIINIFKKSERFLVIDEAENLSVNNLNTLRRIFDLSGATIIYVGTHSLIRNMKGNQGDLLMLYSRCDKYEMQGINNDDWKLLFGDFGNDIKKVTKDIRRSARIFKKAKRYAALANKPLALNFIKMAIQSVILD